MPVYRDYRTPYGVIHFAPKACTDTYRNFVTYDQGGGHTVLTLQRPAMRAFVAAQVRYAKREGWSRERLERNPEGRPILVLPGTNRSCETQLRLWRSDPSRYASPDVTGHTRGIAIDLDTSQANFDIVRSCLRAEGWKWVRPDDEIWHASFGLAV